MLETDIRHAAEDQAEQIVVGKQSGCHDLGEDVHSAAPVRIAHQRQVDQIFDGA